MMAAIPEATGKIVINNARSSAEVQLGLTRGRGQRSNHDHRGNNIRRCKKDNRRNEGKAEAETNARINVSRTGTKETAEAERKKIEGYNRYFDSEYHPSTSESRN
jgi:hypothetical protein